MTTKQTTAALVAREIEIVKTFTLTVLLSLFWLLSSQALAADDDPAVVVIFGDSITSATGYAGCGDLPGQNVSICFPLANRSRMGAVNTGFPAQELTRILNESSRPTLVPNWGHGGTPTGPGPEPDNFGAGTSGIDRISSSLSTSRSQHAGSQYIVLIMYGTNDKDFSLSSSDTGFNIRFMIDRAREQGYTPVIATITTRTDRSPASIASYNSFIRSAAAIRGAPLVDMFEKFEDAGGTSLLFDNVHPTAAGYTVIAETWFNEYLADAIEAGPPQAIIAPILLLLLDD